MVLGIVACFVLEGKTTISSSLTRISTVGAFRLLKLFSRPVVNFSWCNKPVAISF